MNSFKEIATYLLIILLSTFVLTKGVIPAWQNVHSDFANYYVSAQLVHSGNNVDSLYNDMWFHQHAIKMGVAQAIKFSPFPPVTAFVMTPLTFFEVQTASRTWILFNVLLFLPAVIIIKKITSWNLPHSILFILASGLSLTNNIRFGQVYWLMTVALLYSFYWTEQKKEGLSGLILGTFTSIKYFSIIFIASQFFAKHFKAVAISLLTIGFLFLLQFYFFGLTVMKEYFGMALMPHLNVHLSSQNSSAFEFQSW